MADKITNDVAQQIARVKSSAGELQYEVYTVQSGNGSTVLEVFGHLKVISALIYCVGGLDSNGRPTGLGSTFYIGRRRGFLLDSRGPGEENIPYIIGETTLSELQEARLFIYGDVGDKLIMVYRA